MKRRGPSACKGEKLFKFDREIIFDRRSRKQFTRVQTLFSSIQTTITVFQNGVFHSVHRDTDPGFPQINILSG